MAPKRSRRSRQWYSYSILKRYPAVLLVLVALALDSATCTADECDAGYQACEGTVMISCDRREHSRSRVLVRQECSPGLRCVKGSFPPLDSDPAYPIKLGGPQFLCAPDQGLDTRCDNSASFCDCNAPTVCSDGHAVRILGCSTGGVDSMNVPDWICRTDASEPGLWPSCKRHTPGSDPGVDVSALYCRRLPSGDAGSRDVRAD